MKRFQDLKEEEVLALAISSEKEDAQIYDAFAVRLEADFPDTAAIFRAMAVEERAHEHRLVEMFCKKFDKPVPYVTRQDVRGFIKRRPIWLLEQLRIDAVRNQVAVMELESATFYARAEEQATDPDVKRLLHNLFLAERGHEERAETIERSQLTRDKMAKESAVSRRLLWLQLIQPGLAGLIDGSISTMAPIFAAAFATHQSMDAFLVGLAASIGSGISMGITEAMSDDGALSGRGQPLTRGIACGLMTTAGGLGHTLPYLIADFWLATFVAVGLVICELATIAWIRWKYMETPFSSALVQVVLGGLAVVLTGILIGGA